MKVEKILKKLEFKFAQFKLNGDRNLWIVKPGWRSRGRGIQIFNNYDDIMKFVRRNHGGRQVIQKYIENPLIINKRKFDIR